jgi:hypothetical protein
MVLILYDNPMRRLFLNSEIFEPILFTSLVGCAIYLFLTAGQNPGFYYYLNYKLDFIYRAIHRKWNFKITKE